MVLLTKFCQHASRWALKILRRKRSLLGILIRMPSAIIIIEIWSSLDAGNIYPYKMQFSGLSPHFKLKGQLLSRFWIFLFLQQRSDFATKQVGITSPFKEIFSRHRALYSIPSLVINDLFTIVTCRRHNNAQKRFSDDWNIGFFGNNQTRRICTFPELVHFNLLSAASIFNIRAASWRWYPSSNKFLKIYFTFFERSCCKARSSSTLHLDLGPLRRL